MENNDSNRTMTYRKSVIARLEEEVELHETTLKSLSDRKALIKHHLLLVRARSVAHESGVKGLEDRLAQLSKEEKTILRVISELEDAVENCQTAMELVSPKTRSEPQPSTQKLDFSLSFSGVEDIEEKPLPLDEPVDLKKGVDAINDHAKIYAPIPSLRDDQHKMELFWSRSGANGLMALLPSLDSARLISKVLNVCALETLAMDKACAENPTHRAEQLRNTCLDFCACMHPRDAKTTDDKTLQASSLEKESKSKGKVDPNVPLCPYELAGICADSFCPYQHLRPRPGLSSRSIVAPELLPLPPLRKLLSGSNDSRYKEKATVKECETESKTGTDSGHLPSFQCTSSHADSEESDFEVEPYSLEWKKDEDFVLLPDTSRPTSKRRKRHVSSSSSVQDTIESDKASEDSSDDSRLEDRPCWWMSEMDLSRIKAFKSEMYAEKVSLLLLLYIVGGFQIAFSGEDRDENDEETKPCRTNRKRDAENRKSKLLFCTAYPIQGCGDLIRFFGRIIDCTRIVIHAGRCDLAYSMMHACDSVIKKFSEQNADDSFSVKANGSIPSLLLRAKKCLSNVVDMAFGYSTDPCGLIHRAFDMQIALLVASEMARFCSSSFGEQTEFIDNSRVLTNLLDEFESTFFASGMPQSGWKCFGSFDSILEGLEKDGDEFRFLSRCADLFIGLYKDRSMNIAWNKCNGTFWNVQVGKFMFLSISKRSWSSRANFLNMALTLCRTTVHSSTEDLHGLDKGLCKIIFLAYCALGIARSAAEKVTHLSIHKLDASEFASVTELSDCIDRCVVYLSREKSFHESVAGGLGDSLIAPLVALGAAMSSSIGSYAKTQLRLESFLSSSNVESQIKFPLMSNSELLWSQFVQLRASLPSQTDGMELVREHESLSNKIVGLGVHLQHVVIHGDSILVQEMICVNQSPEMTHEKFENAIFLLLSMIESVCSETRPPSEIVDRGKMDLSGLPMVLNPGQRHFISKSSSLLPRSILLAGIRIKSLNLSQCLLDALPLSLGVHLSSLEELILSKNNLLELPRSIGLLKKLKLLNASHNKIKLFPLVIEECANLQVLDLRKNPLETFPDTDLPLKLRKLTSILLDRNSA